MRTIDRILTLISEMEGLSPVEREVLRERVERAPSDDEIKAARLRVAPHASPRAWTDVVQPPS